MTEAIELNCKHTMLRWDNKTTGLYFIDYGNFQIAILVSKSVWIYSFQLHYSQTQCWRDWFNVHDWRFVINTLHQTLCKKCMCKIAFKTFSPVVRFLDGCCKFMCMETVLCVPWLLPRNWKFTLHKFENISPEGHEEWHPHNWPVTTTNHLPPHLANYLGHQRVSVFV